MARLDIDGLELAYSDEGRGDPLQLVHGSASDQRTWEGQRGEFARHFRVVAFSRRYHWPNPPIPPDAQYTMREQLEDLKRVPRVLGIDSAHFVGHSYGAFLCLLLAIESPALVRTLVLAEPPVITLLTSNAPTPLELVKLALTRPRTLAAIVRFGLKGVAPARRAIADGRIEEGNRIFGDAVLGAGGFAGLSEARRQQVLDNGSNAAAELLGPGFEPLTAAQVRSVTAPVLLAGGDRSVALFARLLDRLEELLPDADRIVIPRAGHILHEDNSPAFNDAVMTFLERCA